jgi:hypothetical protein
MNLRIIFAFVFLINLIACTKDDLPAAEGTRLAKTIARSGDSLVTTYYHYDNSGALISIFDTNNNNHGSRMFLHYNSSGKLVQTEEYYDGASSPNTSNYIYENNKLVTKMNTSPTGVTNKNRYAYDGQGRLIADTTYDYWIPNTLQVYSLFHYNNDDVASIEYFYNNAGSWSSAVAGQFSYNAEQNPYQAIGLNLYVVNGVEEGLNKHLITQIVSPSVTVSYSYQYYSNGLVHKIAKHYSNGWAEDSEIEFFYE